MNYLYKESTISSPIDNILIIDQYILAHHHITLSVYDLNLNLLRRKNFYDKILNIKKINKFSFIILFSDGKIVQSDLYFNPLCLRIVEEMTEIDTYNNYCIAYNQYSIKWFNTNNDGIKDLALSGFGIFNIKTMFFLENYIPILIIVSEFKNESKCYILSLDGDPMIVDKFDLIDNVMSAKSIDKYLIFLNRNFIQIKYKRDNYVINLNGNFDSDILPESLKTHIIKCTYDENRESRRIFLENPFVFAKDNLIFILDSNGEFFQINLELDVKKIFSGKISFLDKISIPSSIDFDSKYLAIGSCMNDTVLFEIQNFKENQKIKNTFEADVNCQKSNQQDKNYLSYDNGKNRNKRIISCNSEIKLVERARIHNIGIVKCFEPQDNNTLLITTTSGLFTGKFFIDFEISLKSKVHFKFDRIFVNESGIVAISQSKAYSIDTNLNVSQIQYTKNLNTEQFFMNFKIFLDSSKRLIFSHNGFENFILEDIDCWAVGVGKIAFISNGSFKILELPSFKIIFSAPEILKFEDNFFNEIFTNSDDLEKVESLKYRPIGTFSTDEKVLEILLAHHTHTFILFRTTKQLYIYQYSFGKIEKCFIPKLIVLGSENQTLFNIFDMVYCRSKHPCLISFKNGISVFPCSLKISFPVTLDDWIYGFYKGNLIKVKIKLENCIFSDKMLLEPLYMFDYSSENLKNFNFSDETLVNEVEPNKISEKDSVSSVDQYDGNDFVKRRKTKMKFENVPEDIETSKEVEFRPSSAISRDDREIHENSKTSFSDETQQRDGYSWIEKEKISIDRQKISEADDVFNENLTEFVDKESELIDELIDNGIIINKNENENIKIVEPRNIPEEYRNNPMIKNIVVGNGCFIFVFAKYEEFVYIPFIPTVHMSDPQTGKTHSEPINKEEAEYKNPYPVLRARTLQFTLELRSKDFKIMSSLSLEPCEFVCDAKIIFKDYLVICTSFLEGEDKKSKGKLTVYALTDIVYDPENPHVTKKLKFISSESFKDACLYAIEIRSLIAVCVGTKLMIYEFNINTGLCVMGVNEVSLLSTCLYATKNFLAISDIFNGLFFFFLRPRDPLKLHLLGKSVPIPDCRHLLGIDFDSPNENNSQLSLLALDKYGTIHAFTYSPDHTAHTNSNLLVKRAEVVTKTNYPLMYTFSGKINNYEALFFSNNFMTSLMTISVPRIQILQHYISVSITNTCGINPRNYLETTKYRNLECKSVICERILLEFFYLTPEIQKNICKSLGITYEIVVEMIEKCLIHHK